MNARTMRQTTAKIILGTILGIFCWLGPWSNLAIAESLSWQGSIEETAKNNAELRAATNNLRATEYSANAAFSNFLPQISASLGYSYGDIDSNTISTAANNNYSAGLSASQSLFNGWQDKARLDQANAAVEIAKTDLEIIKAKISFILKSAYAGLRFAQESVKLQNEIIQRREENYRLVELRFESGRENKGSVLLSKAYLNQAHYDALQAQDNIRIAQTQLTKILGRDQVGDYTVADPVPIQPATIIAELSSLALKTPTVRQALARQNSASAGVTLERGSFSPTIDLSGSLSREDTDWFPENQRWSVGATLNIPLFNGGKNYFRTKGALATSAATAANRFTALSQTVTDLQQSYSTYTQAEKKLVVDDSFQKAAESRAEIARSKYNNGLLSFEDWDLIENDLIARQKNLLLSQRDRVIAEANWEQTQGKGVLP
jgi:outer membrane protein TolC